VKNGTELGRRKGKKIGVVEPPFSAAMRGLIEDEV